MIIDRWKACGRKSNKQIKKRRHGMMKSNNNDYKKNNNILSKEKSKLPISIQFAYLNNYMANLNLFVVLI